MHEISLVRNIVATLESEFSPEELKRLEQIDLQVGLLSNVEPLLMDNAFSAVQEAEGKLIGVKLVIETIPVEVYCEDCQKRSPITQYRFVCAGCGLPNNNVVAGTELLIHRVHFAEPSAIQL